MSTLLGNRAALAPPLAESLRTALAEHDTHSALRLCEARLETAPDDADAHRHLGLIHAANGKRWPALQAAKRACELAPRDPRTWSDLGRVYAMVGQLEEAAKCFADVVAVDARYADGWHNLGLALSKLGRREQAFAALKNALLLDPTRADTYLVLGNLLIGSDQFEDALECFERAAKHNPALARARSRLAGELSLRGKVRRAESLFRQSLGLDPDHVEGWLGLARTLEDLGESEGAESAYLNVLRRRPGHALALGSYLGLARGDAGEWQAKAQAALSDDTTRDEARAAIGYGLAKYHDRRSEFAEAASAGLIANAARRSASGRLDRVALTARVDGIIGTYTAKFFSARRRFGLGNDQPVFIVGLPRSGTTLTEQILSAHPMLHGAGELADLARLAMRLTDANSGEPWRAAERLDENRSREYAHHYLQALRDGTPKGRLRISDKSPLNFFQLGFAALLFSGARVVHCRRSPRDNALSIWMENFNVEQRYATDFDDLAFFHAEYSRLMAHWNQVLPLRMLDMCYEDTVADPERQVRRLMDFLGVPWDARCLEFHRSERAVQTPSRWQVRQPIYASSVDRWRHYAQFLDGLKNICPADEVSSCV